LTVFDGQSDYGLYGERGQYEDCVNRIC